MTMPSGILDYFTPGRTPREGQVQALKSIEENWGKADVFVVEIPVGGGKSDVATTIARWAAREGNGGHKSLILTPNNILLQQYQTSNPKLAALMGKSNYTCRRGTTSQYTPTCGGEGSGIISAVGPRGGQKRQLCPECPYMASVRRLHAVPYGVTNYHMLMAGKFKKSLLIFDEAHNLLPFMRTVAAKRIWKHEANYPSNLRTYSDLLKWLASVQPRHSLLYSELRTGTPRWLVEKGWERHYGTEKECLNLLPIDTSNEPPLLWPPNRVKKLVLMSATIGSKDLEQLGLSKRRVCWVSTPSPIPPQRRPVTALPAGFDLSFSSGGSDLDAVADWIGARLDQHAGQRGVIHVTYALMEQLKPRLSKYPRVSTHTREDKKAQYAAFLAGPDDAVLMCAGLYEGIDLPGDLGRWQVICKVPWPSLQEPAWKWIAETDRMRYCWETLRTVMQGAGRVCRGPEDFGITYLIDKSFANLPVELMPGWFREALEAGRLI